MHFYFVEWLSLWLFLLFPGVRQWYPLSSLLFGLAKDYLNRLLTDLVQSNDLNLMAATREVAALSHLLYVNDVLLFCKAFTCNICCISDAFAEYGELFGQLVNWEKSFLYTRINVSTSRCNFFLNLFCMKCSGLLFVYLDVLLFQGAPTISHLSPIVDRILTQLEACKGRLLSFLGRLCLINSIITSKKVITIAWDQCYLPLAAAGSGIKNLFLFNKSLVSSYVWKIWTNASPVFIFLRSLFRVKEHYVASSIWPTVRAVYP